MEDHGADFVAFSEKRNNLDSCEPKIVFRGGRPELDFFQRGARLLFTRSSRFLALLIEKNLP